MGIGTDGAICVGLFLLLMVPVVGFAWRVARRKERQASDRGQLAQRVIAGEGNAPAQATLVAMQYQARLAKDEKGREAA